MKKRCATCGREISPAGLYRIGRELFCSRRCLESSTAARCAHCDAPLPPQEFCPHCGAMVPYRYSLVNEPEVEGRTQRMMQRLVPWRREQ